MSVATITKKDLLIRNVGLNFAGNIVPIVLALLTVPYVVHRLGVDRYGVFALVAMVLGYFNLFDLGLGRATTKYVAEMIGRGEHGKIPGIVHTSVVFVFLLGCVAAVIIVLLTPVLVDRVLNIPSYMMAEVKLVFYMTAPSVVIFLLNSSLRGVLEAYQRFGLINAINIPSNVLNYVIPVAVLFFGGGLPLIVFALIVKNFFFMLITLFYSMRQLPHSDEGRFVDFSNASMLVNFGKWTFFENVISIITNYSDRLLIGMFLTVSALTYYTLPLGLAMKLSLIPASITPVLFPAFSALDSLDRGKLQALFLKSFKYIVIIMGAIVGMIVLFSSEFLVLWLGEDFGKSAPVLQLLSIAFFIGALTGHCNALLHGVGRPRITTFILLFIVPVYLVVIFFLVKYMGIVGAAVAWLLKSVSILSLQLLYCRRAKLLDPAELYRNGTVRFALALVILTAGGLAIKSYISFSTLNLAWFSLGYVVMSSIFIWNFALNREDRMFIVDLKNSFNFSKAKAA